MSENLTSEEAILTQAKRNDSFPLMKIDNSFIRRDSSCRRRFSTCEWTLILPLHTPPLGLIHKYLLSPSCCWARYFVDWCTFWFSLAWLSQMCSNSFSCAGFNTSNIFICAILACLNALRVLLKDARDVAPNLYASRRQKTQLTRVERSWWRRNAITLDGFAERLLS